MEKTINFRISEENKLELQFIAEEKEIKVSHLVREIINDFIEDYYEDESPVYLDNIEPIEVFLEIPSDHHQYKKID
ncbi:hypothetical protein BW723_16495 [Polaribacter reichenbachii]|uniref:Uncharacterized protein n=1 Tax=Polaribacter reichenbachii TaxID=996801 RepID=A0A1B8TRW8_9FLAO|nr:hypothetical protein [Polaribacter reichenbachii]APZ47796.1 hypothetical protein BW723_16495 [Polaribacter reichenbachii]AUC18431.1 hypothetical protein BTO17_06915 [Polaribacter reichenbachii]OBY62218.1 hypothetical protein LPB301_15150 [Polaribacter reichenbachii]